MPTLRAEWVDAGNRHFGVYESADRKDVAEILASWARNMREGDSIRLTEKK